MLHCSVCEPLLEWNAQLFEARTSSLDIIDRDRDVPKPFAGLGIPVRILEAGVVLRAFVVRQLENAY